MAIWKLTIEDDEGQKTVVPLVRDEYTLGRKEGHTIRLTERNISRDHAKLRKNGEGYVLEDLGSYNGVFVNGHRVAEPTPVNTGDLIIIGDYRIEAHNEDVARVVGVSTAPKPMSQPPPPQRQAPPRLEKPHRLVLLTGEGAGKEYPLEKPKMILGRGDDVDVRVNHSSVSRHHCELHIVGEGRFELRDQASANGIRVNGQEVKQAVLAPGDLVELGDVQLKYIPAGQAFVFDAAEQEAVREIEMRNERARKRSGAGTWAIVVLLVAAAAAGGVMLARQGGDEKPPTASASTPATPKTQQTSTAANEDPLAAAFAKLNSGDPIGAYDLVKADPDARSMPDFVKIANGWAERRIEILKDEADPEAKKAGVAEIMASAADEDLKKQAEGLLAGSVEPVPTKTAPDAGKPVPTTTTTKPTVTATATATTKPTVTATATATTATTKPTVTATVKPTATVSAAAPTVGNCPSYKGDYPTASKNGDWECVRTMLLPRLNAGQISSGEARYLKAACTQLSDISCAKRAAEKM
jgi:ABC transport system ATP-binding/permease protein